MFRSNKYSLQARLALIMGIGGFLIYLLQLSSGSNWRDGAEFIGVATTFGISHPTGYPLFSILGRLSVVLFSLITDPATGANLLSAVAGGATLAVLTLVAWKLSGLLRLGPIPLVVRSLAALLPPAVLGCMSLFMEQAVVAEVYTLHTLLASILLLLGLEGVLQSEKPVPLLAEGSSDLRLARIWGSTDWRIPLLLAYVAGIAIGNHLTIVIIFPALVLLLWWALNPETPQPEIFQPTESAARITRILVPVLVAGLLGLSLYLLVPLRASMHPPFNWGDAVTLRRFVRLITAAEARMRPPTYFPITALGLWGKIAQVMGWPMLVISMFGWIWTGLRRPRMGIVAALYLLFPMLFLLLKLDILDDALLPVHMFVALGAGAFVLLSGERIVLKFGPGRGGYAVAGMVVLLVALGPGQRLIRNWGEITPARQGGPDTYLAAVIASVEGEPDPVGEVEGWVFAEDNLTAFVLWLEGRLGGRHPQLHGIYLLLAREEWYREELRRRIPTLSVPALDASYERLPHEAAARELLSANTQQDKPLYLSPILLPSGDVYGALIPQGVLLRMEPPGYVPSREDVERHLSVMETFAPAFGAGELPRLDRHTRDWWSWRHSLIGNAWLRLGLLPAAEAEFRAGVRINPGRLETWMELAVFFEMVGDWRGAESTLREALAISPRDDTVRLKLALALTRLGAFTEADSILHASRMRNAPRSEYLRVRAGIELGQGDASAALNDLEEATRLDPESAEIWNDLGVAYLRKGQWDDSVEAFQVAVKLQPSRSEAWANLGMLALQDAKWEEAEGYLSNAMDTGASIDTIRYALGVARMNLQDITGAEEVWRQNLRDWPLHADTYFALGSLLERQGRIREAITIYENGRMAIPGDGRFGSRLRALRPPPAP